MDTRDVDVFEGTWKSALRRQFTLAMHGLANRWADGQTAITTRMAELVRIPPVQLWGTWPSGVDLVRFTPAQTDRQWPEPDGTVRLIYIGKMRVGCNLEPLCRAVERANAEGMAFLLSLVGEGPERPRLEELALSSGGCIRVQPAVPNDGVPELLKQAHVGVTALFAPEDKLFGASSPLKLFEYMAAGLPILSTRNPCHTEVVGEEGYGFWAEDASEGELVAALRRVWQERDTLGEKGMQAAGAATAWTWAASAQRLSHALQRGLLEGGVGSAHGFSG
jgi:glycosyltransferase involved in cell wall biosynthesis